MAGIRDKFDEYFSYMRINNHFAAFLNELIQLEFSLVDTEEAVRYYHSDMKNFVGHRIPSDNKMFYDLQILILKDDGTYLRKLDQFVLPQNDSIEELQRFCNDVQQFYKSEHERHAKKQTGTVKIILRLAKNFMEEMKLLHNKTNISFFSLHKIFETMTSFYKTVDAIFEQKSDALKYYDLIVIPSSVPLNERDDYILNISKRIYDLLLECYWVLYISATYELNSIMQIYLKSGLKLTKKYLYHAAVYPVLEDAVWQIDTHAELVDYLNYEFYSFFKFFPEFQDYVHDNIQKIAVKRMRLLGTSVGHHKGKSFKQKKRMTQEEIDESQERIFSESFKDETDSSDDNTDESATDNFYGNESYDESFEQDSGDHDKYSQDNYSEEYVKKKNKPDMESYQKSFETEKKAFINSLLAEHSNKNMLQGPLATYKLKGNPEKPLNYLVKILSNIGYSMIEHHINQVIKDKYHVPPRTLRRYEKDIKQGKIKISDSDDIPGETFKIKELSPEEIKAISDEKAKSSRHQEAGYLTQRRLINLLRDDSIIKGLNKKGIKFRKFSYPTLLLKLKELIELKNIEVKRTKNSYLYKADEDNFATIASQIMKIS